MVQAKDALPGMTPGAIVPQSDQDVEPGFTPTALPSAAPPIVSGVQAKPTIHGTEEDRSGLSSWAPELNMLYDTTTGKPVRLDYKDIGSALLEGRVGFKKGESIPMISSDGKSYNLPSENVVAALQQGYRIEHPQEIAVREFSAENKGIGGATKAFLTNFADEALFGVPGIVYQHSGDVSDLERAKLETLKKDNPIANAVGGIGGFGASMFYGGELFQLATKGGRVAEGLVKGGQLAERLAIKGAEKTAAELAIKEGEDLATKTLVNRMVEQGVAQTTAERVAPGFIRNTAANMAKYGVEGAIISAPKTVTEAYYDPALAGEHLAIGIGTGALLGTLGPLGRGFTKLTGNMTKAFPEMLSEFQPGAIAARAAGAERGTAMKFGKDELNNYGKILVNEGVIDGPMHFQTLKQRVGDFKKASGEEIGSILNKLEEKSNQPELYGEKPNIIGVQNALKDLRDKFSEPIYKKEQKTLDQIIATVEKIEFEGIPATQRGTGEPVGAIAIPFPEAQNLKQMIGDLAKWEHTAKGKVNEVRQDAYRIVMDGLDDAVLRVAEKTDPTLSAAYQKAKENYKAASIMDQLINVKDARANNKIFGLTDSIVGGGATGAGMIGSIMAGNFLPMLFPVLTFTGKKIMESTYFQTGMASLLNKTLNNSGLVFAEQALKYGALQMDRIPEVLSKPMEKVTPSTVSLSAISRFLGQPEQSNKSPQDRNKLLSELSSKINSAMLNQKETVDKLTKLSAPLSYGGAPKLSQAYIAQTIKTFQYLQSILPNADKSLTPFKKNINQVSDQQLADFERALRVVENPYNVIDSLANGTVTQKEVDTLAAIYPNVYREMNQKIQEFAYSGKASELPYQTRLKLSLIMGIHLDQSTQDTKAYQGNFAAPAKAQGAGPKVNIVTPKSNPLMTPTQMLANRK